MTDVVEHTIISHAVTCVLGRLSLSCHCECGVLFCTGNFLLLKIMFCLVQLVDEAYQRWLVEEEGVVDDITAVVVKFHHD